MECHVTLKRFFVQMLAIFRRCKNWRSTLKLNRKPSKKPSGSVPCWGHGEKGDVMGSKGWWMMNLRVFFPPEWILRNHPFHFSAVGAWKGESTRFWSKSSRLNDLLAKFCMIGCSTFLSPFPSILATRIFTCLVANSCNPSFTTVIGECNPKYNSLIL